jgi:hypothetical protein
LVGGALLVLYLAIPMADASNTERDEYVAKVEPICKRNVLATKRIFRGARAQVKAGKLKLASRHFVRAARAFGRTVHQLAAVPQPSADAPRLTRWLGLLQNETTIIRRIGAALAAEDKHKAQSRFADLVRNSSRANNTVVTFGFNYCKIEPSRFG